jgi:predicted nucleic acid-binding protein
VNKAVIDASVVLRWAFRDEVDRDGAARVGDALASGALEAVGPPHFLLEVTSALAVGIRTGRISRSDADGVVAGLSKIAITEGDSHGFAIAVFELAMQHAIRVPDAAYIETARGVGAVLVSADRAQVAAASDLGVPVRPIGDVIVRIPDSP